MNQDKTPHAPLAGKRILLTGGTTGIGRAALLALAQQGARLVTFGRDADPLEEAIAACGSADVNGLVADASRPEDVARVFEKVDTALGGIDVLIANAAVGSGPLEKMAPDDWRYVVATNLTGTMACTAAALERMRAQQAGQLVFISSISPEIKAPGESVYAATKGGINAFALTLRKEVAESNIRVTVIEPGSVGSDMQPCTAEEQREAIAKGEMLFAEEIAEAVMFVLSRSERCDVPMLRIEPVRQKTG